MIVDQVEKNKVYDVLTAMANTGKLMPFTVSLDGQTYARFSVTTTSANLNWVTEPEPVAPAPEPEVTAPVEPEPEVPAEPEAPVDSETTPE